MLIVMPLAHERGGAEIALSHLLGGAGNLARNLHVIFFEDGPLLQVAREAGAMPHVVPAGRLRQPRRMVACIRALARIARRAPADVILSWMGKGHLYAGPAALLAGVPAAWFQHGIPAQSSPIDALATLLPASLVLACSRTAAVAQERLWPRRRTHVAYPPVDLERFDPARLPTSAQARKDLDLPGDGQLIGMVGRLQRWKGFHVLIEAMPRILSARPDTRCVLVGGEHALEADYPAVLRRQIESLGLGERVMMVGAQRDVPRWMQAMDVVVHASDAEPFGMVIIEAMALGKPIIATAAAGPTEIITPGVDGLLYPFGDREALATATLRCLNDAGFAGRLGEAARARAAAFSAQRFANDVMEALTELVHPKPAELKQRGAASFAAPLRSVGGDIT